MIPHWLHLVALAVLLTGLLSAIVIAFDVARHPQHMAVMNIVWPVSALYAGPIALWGYFRYGRLATHEAMMPAIKRGEEPPSKKLTPFPVIVGTGAAHCGAGADDDRKRRQLLARRFFATLDRRHHRFVRRQPSVTEIAP